MLHIIFAAVVLFTLLFLLTASIHAGRRLGKKHLARNNKQQLEIVTVAEGAVFALLGLLIAFTFSDSYQRFEERKMHIIKEAEAYQATYLLTDLLAPQTQPKLRQLLREYVDSRLTIYQKFPHISEIEQEYNHEKQIGLQLWKAAIEALRITHDSVATELFIPALNDMFATADTGYLLAWVHAPGIIFILLIGLASLGAFLTGYSTAKNQDHNPLYTYSYIILTSFTIFLIINLELPRLGLVRLTMFDQVIADVRDQWQP